VPLHVVKKAKLRDRKHMIYYGLIATAASKCMNKALHDKCVTMAMSACRVLPVRIQEESS
jgi:hypothetical protein